MAQPQEVETRGLAPEPTQIMLPEATRLGWMDIAAICTVMGGAYAFLTRILVGPMIERKVNDALDQVRKDIENSREHLDNEIQRVDKSYHDFKDILMKYFMEKAK